MSYKSTLHSFKRISICLVLAFGALLSNFSAASAQEYGAPGTFGPPGAGCTTCGPGYQPLAQPQVVTSGQCQPCTVAVDCADNIGRRQSWRDLHPYPFQPLAHGEFLGPVRIPSTVDYQARIGDQIRFTYILSRDVLSDSYLLRPGDQLEISSLTDETLKMGNLDLGKGALIQPDGMLHLKMIGSVRASGLTIDQLRHNLEVAYKGQIITPAIDVIPVDTNTLLKDIYSAVDNTAGSGGHAVIQTVNADGTVRLPKLGAVRVGGMTFDEIKREINLRYQQIVPGLEVEPNIQQQAVHNVFVAGLVGQAGRFQLDGPTTVMGAIAQAQGFAVGANARQIVVYRRAEDWRLIATRIDLNGMQLGKVPTPADDIWLRDGDIVIVPPTPITRANQFIQQWFTDGIYSVFPFFQIGSDLEVGAGVNVAQ